MVVVVVVVVVVVMVLLPPPPPPPPPPPLLLGEADGADDGADEADGADTADGAAAEADMAIGLEVRKVEKHFVYSGARPGSLQSVYVRLLFEDGSHTEGGYESAEPLALSECGRAALLAYVKTKSGSKIAKYMPFT